MTKDELMVCRDVSNFYPSCDTKNVGMLSKKLLLTRKYNYPSAKCILEAIGMTMTSNSTKFSNRFFTQIDGATIGSPDSGSITDIFGAVFIDKKFMEECPKKQTIISCIEMTQLMFARTQLKRSSKK